MNFERHDEHATPILANRLASYTDTGVFALSRAWSHDIAAQHDRVLEVGPGLGDGVAALRDAGVDVTYTDAAVGFAQRAQPYAPGTVADIATLPYRDNSFDAVVADRVLHHVTHWEAALDELTRVLRPGGVFISTLPRYDTIEFSAYQDTLSPIAAASVEPGVLAVNPTVANCLAGLRSPLRWCRRVRWNTTMSIESADAYLRFDELAAASVENWLCAATQARAAKELLGVDGLQVTFSVVGDVFEVR